MYEHGCVAPASATSLVGLSPIEYLAVKKCVLSDRNVEQATSSVMEASPPIASQVLVAVNAVRNSLLHRTCVKQT